MLIKRIAFLHYDASYLADISHYSLGNKRVPLSFSSISVIDIKSIVAADSIIYF